MKGGETFSLAWEPVLWAERPAGLHGETTSGACNFHPAPQPHKSLLRAAGWALVKHQVLVWRLLPTSACCSCLPWCLYDVHYLLVHAVRVSGGVKGFSPHSNLL